MLDTATLGGSSILKNFSKEKKPITLLLKDDEGNEVPLAAGINIEEICNGQAFQINLGGRVVTLTSDKNGAINIATGPYGY